MQNKQRIDLIKLHKIQNFPQDSNAEGQTKDGNILCKYSENGNYLKIPLLSVVISGDWHLLPGVRQILADLKQMLAYL